MVLVLAGSVRRAKHWELCPFELGIIHHDPGSITLIHYKICTEVTLAEARVCQIVNDSPAEPETLGEILVIG